MTITFLDPENKYIKEYPKDVHKGYFFANDRFNNIDKESLYYVCGDCETNFYDDNTVAVRVYDVGQCAFTLNINQIVRIESDGLD